MVKKILRKNIKKKESSKPKIILKKEILTPAPKPSKNFIKLKLDLGTKSENTWCPGCPNFMILESVKRTIAGYMDQKKYKKEDFAITTDIGCHGKIFDYLNLSGIYGLHGRAIPTGIGMKLGNPNLKVITFAGDGAMYSEGISHLIHAFKENPDTNLFVHDNQSFSLTTGQSTPTSQTGFVTKSEPFGEFDKPLNPLKIALASNATFIARANARDIVHTTEIMTKAINHKGFSFVEIMQDCIVFNLDQNFKDKRMYKIEDNTDLRLAEKLCSEFDYNSKEGKIPLGVLYQNANESCLEDRWPQLRYLQKAKKNWINK